MKVDAGGPSELSGEAFEMWLYRCDRCDKCDKCDIAFLTNMRCSWALGIGPRRALGIGPRRALAKQEEYLTFLRTAINPINPINPIVSQLGKN